MKAAGSDCYGRRRPKVQCGDSGGGRTLQGTPSCLRRSPGAAKESAQRWCLVGLPLKMKSLQFRTIAPKAPAAVPAASRTLLSCQPPSALPEASTASTPKSIIVPTQNYALMQIAGQDGTFSLVALPPAVSSQTPQQHQQTPKNLKLPIPRYQAARSKAAPDKSKMLPASKTKIMPKVAASTQTKLLPKAPKEEPSDQLLFIDQASSDLSVTALLPDNAVLYPGSQVDPKPDPTEHIPTTTGLVQNIQYPAPAMKASPGKSPEESKTAVQLCQSKPSNSITVLSPAIFSKAVQIIPSPPKGKLPILPYSKMKNSLIPAANLSSVTPEKNNYSNQPLLPSPSDSTSKTLPVTDKHITETTQQSPVKATLVPILGTLQKSPGRKRGRKRKTMEDILAFEARKKRSLSFFRRRVPEKPPAVAPSKQKEVDISKKYRSIRPKPLLVMETVPQLVNMSTLTSDSQETELTVGPQTHNTLGTSPAPASVALHLRGVSHSRLHRCPTCSRSFQFKHHLQSHMNSHTNSRPYACPVCRKAYAHSGSLSTHMKLHHSEVRPRRVLCCEFCQKAFGYVGVYFSHLREVHRVVLTVEPSISQHEDKPTTEGGSEAGDEEREDPVELQIKCGRCQAITPTFADMKMHLRHVHGEELSVPEGQASHSGREAEDELVKHAAHYWRQLNHKRNLVKCGSCDEEFFSFSKLKRHVMSHHFSQDGESSGGLSPDSDGGRYGILSAKAGLNCVLCPEVLVSRDSVLEHWRSRHHCEQPALLWDALSSYSGQEELDLDTPHPSPH